MRTLGLLAAAALTLAAAAPAAPAYPRGFRGALKVKNLSGQDLPPLFLEDWLDEEVVVGPVDFSGPKGKVRGLRQHRFYRVGIDRDGNGSIDSWSFPVFLRRRAKVLLFE